MSSVPTSPESDRNAMWVARLQMDDEHAMGEIIDIYFDDLAELAFHYVRTQDIARDIAQETIISCWDHRHTLNADTILIHYLRRSVRNRALNVLRQDTRAAHWETRVMEESNVTTPYADNMGLASVEADEFGDVVQRVAQRLTPRVREVWLLYYQRGLEPNEIATVLGVAPSTVYNQLRKAMQRFAEALGRWRG